eukprot:CAMPEP_0183553714 /NCGR_PEP_ID=MMETSP0371-20130417/75612_1 /TAXON_ID=268820 /ORGANISM="Peridinium aciculiferum, Strain PAER-2" /LENGTH=99 /DNA_ID=CAMNT_0025759299 /DNA_START=36 /DNA_END=335 /DNA_ORIENTATION=+
MVPLFGGRTRSAAHRRNQGGNSFFGLGVSPPSPSSSPAAAPDASPPSLDLLPFGTMQRPKTESSQSSSTSLASSLFRGGAVWATPPREGPSSAPPLMRP